MIKDLISVIIANYNNAKYLEQCLDSVLMQSYQSVEIIIADDCSTDDSKEILLKYSNKHSNIKVIFNQINMGVTKNRHNAILNSQGEFLTTLDADDFYYDSDKLKSEMLLLKYHKNKFGKDIIAYSNTALVDEDGQLLNFWYDNQSIPEGNILEPVFFRNCIIPRDFLFSRDAYDLIGGYDTKIGIYEDYDLDIRLAKHLDFYYTAKPGVAYRQTSSGLSKSKKDTHLKWLLYIVKKNNKLIDDAKKYNKFKNQLFKTKVINNLKSNKFTLRCYNAIKRIVKFTS